MPLIDQSTLNQLKAILAAVLLWATPSLAQTANQDINFTPWATLPDGRVVIEVKGHKFAFPNDAETLQNIEFIISPKEASDILPRYGAINAQLSTVIKQPDLARKAFAAASNVGIFVVPHQSEKKLARSGGGFATFYFWVNVNYSPYEDNKCDEVNYKLVSKKDADGFEVTRDDRVPALRYCLPAKQRGFASDKDLRINCRMGGGGDYVCSAWFYGKDVAVGYSFYRKEFPESDWRNLDVRMHRYFNQFIISEEVR